MIVYIHSITKIDSQRPCRPPTCNFITISDFSLVPRPTDLKRIAETLERVSQCDVIFTKFTSIYVSGSASYQRQNDLNFFRIHCLCIKT